MEQKYEYKFVRLGQGWLGVRRSGTEQYQETIHAHAREGWRLVQIFSPAVNGFSSTYFELVFEREVGR